MRLHLELYGSGCIHCMTDLSRPGLMLDRGVHADMFVGIADIQDTLGGGAFVYVDSAGDRLVSMMHTVTQLA